MVPDKAITVRAPDRMLERLEQEVENNSLFPDRSKLIRHAITEYLAKGGG